MRKYSKILIAVVLVVAIGLVGFLVYKKYLSKSEKVTEAEFPENPQKGDFGYQEPKTSVEIGSKEVNRGKFIRIEDSNIFLAQEDSTTLQYPLTQPDVSFACTTQDLNNASVLDYNLITKINLLKTNEVSARIPTDEVVVVFSQVVEGELRVHTVAIDSSKCE